MLTQSLWGARPKAEKDETIISAGVGFLASPSSEKQAQKWQQMITIFSNWQGLDSNGGLKGKKDLWAHIFSIWKLFVKSGRGRQGQSPAVLRIWKFHPGSISSITLDLSGSEFTHWAFLGHFMVCAHSLLSWSFCATGISPKESFQSLPVPAQPKCQHSSIQLRNHWAWSHS